MKKSLLVYVCALLTGVVLYSCKPSDAKIQKSVETALSTTNTGISSAVKDGVVTLSGTVDTEEAKAAAEQVLKAVKDVKSITNNIEVKAPAVVINPDDILTTTVNSAISAAGFSGVAVAVKDGEVTLTGDVKKVDLAKLMQVANEAKPKKVINQLTIK